MSAKVLAIGLDAADPDVVEGWLKQGHLPNLQALIETGAYGRLTNVDFHRAEVPWTAFLSGCLPEKTGYWTPVNFRPDSYDPSETQAYDFDEYPPFYALGEKYRVAVFDMPQTALSEQVNGIQILAWGAHSPQTPSHSLPQGLLSEIEVKYGKHPRLNKDFADPRDSQGLAKLYNEMLVGLRRRSQICQELLERDDWDLFLTIFGEPHSAGHSFWHLSQQHPLKELGICDEDYMLRTFQDCDQVLGELLDQIAEDTYIVVFSVHGMTSNILDLSSRLFLPELLYRWSFEGHKAISVGRPGKSVGQPIQSFRRRGWMGDIWGLKSEPNPLKSFLRYNLPTGAFNKVERYLGPNASPDLESPFEQMANHDGLFYMPANWYKPFWKDMKAFALPSHSEGCIRINLQGREAHGLVPASDYQLVCDELCQMLADLTDPRTGQSMVRDVIRTRTSGYETDSKLPDSDLLVMWNEEVTTDVVESPQLGRIGPVPYHRTGSHHSQGFVAVKGPGIEASTIVGTHPAVDMPATLLQMMGAPIPSYFDGKPIS
ncbi:MAG: alkaline phosphatase family protein, partial [Cyanobacteria bacterium P01_F01_bin.116]